MPSDQHSLAARAQQDDGARPGAVSPADAAGGGPAGGRSRGVGLSVEGVNFGYRSGFRLSDVTFELRPGEQAALLGPNGSGKTTLLRLAAGTLRPGSGVVRLQERPLAGLSRREVARCVAVLPQEARLPFAFTVREVVALGRTPHQGAFGGERRADRLAVEAALAAVGLADRSDRLFEELSGGERRRVLLALALAQEPGLLLLDEPTAHLDVAAQVDVLELVQGLSRARGLTVLAAIHDLNLAALYFPRLILLDSGTIVADGSADVVLRSDLIRRVYGAEVVVERHPRRPVPHVVVLPRTRNGRTGESDEV